MGQRPRSLTRGTELFGRGCCAPARLATATGTRPKPLPPFSMPIEVSRRLVGFWARPQKAVGNATEEEQDDGGPRWAGRLLGTPPPFADMPGDPETVLRALCGPEIHLIIIPQSPRAANWDLESVLVLEHGPSTPNECPRAKTFVWESLMASLRGSASVRGLCCPNRRSLLAPSPCRECALPAGPPGPRGARQG